MIGLSVLALAGAFGSSWSRFEEPGSRELPLADEDLDSSFEPDELEGVDVVEGFKGPPSQNLGHGSALIQPRLTDADEAAASLCSANTDRTISPDLFGLEVEPPDLTKGFFGFGFGFETEGIKALAKGFFGLGFETESVIKELALAKSLSTFRFLCLLARVATICSTLDKVRLVRRVRSMDSSFGGSGPAFGSYNG